MKEIEINITKEEVWAEVQTATDYTGAKAQELQPEAKGVRDRVLMTDAAQTDLERIWKEACMGTDDGLKEFIRDTKESTDPSDQPRPENGEGYRRKLEVSEHYNKELTESVKLAIKGHLVAWILSEWFGFSSKEEAADWGQAAAAKMQTAMRLLWNRKRPQRPGAR